MGYALFANRKIYYTSLINDINSKLDNISQQRQRLLDLSASIADGKITVDELASDPLNFQYYYDFLQGVDAYENTDDENGGIGTTVGNIGSMATEAGYEEEDLEAVAELLDSACSVEYAKIYEKQIEAEENQLDTMKNKYDTQLTAAQKQLEAVEQAEGKAIDEATPKYSGLQ